MARVGEADPCVRLRVYLIGVVEVPTRPESRACSGRELRRCEAAWRATGCERAVRRMTNSIRPDAVASLRMKGEARTRERSMRIAKA